MSPSGILLLDKPAGISSAQALRKIEKHFRIEKIGHGGTLDPFATGVLVLLIGEATKIARFLLSGAKAYSAVAHIGFETDTGDREGQPIGEEKLPPASEAAWRDSLPKFLGKIQQIPPKYSALKVAGKRLYEYARAGKPVEIEARSVEIHSLSLREYAPERIRFDCSSSGGTYIRTLAEDWARAAGTRAFLQDLRRTQSGSFSIGQCFTMEQLLERNPDSLPALIPIPQALSHLPQLHCNPEETKKIQAGLQGFVQDFLRDSGILTRARDEDFEHILLLHGAAAAPEPLALLSRQTGEEVLFKLDRVFR